MLHIQKVGGIAGSELHLLSLLPALKDRGLEPRMLVLAGRDGSASEFVQSMRLHGVGTDVVSAGPDVDPVLLLRLLRYIGHDRFDLVHTHLVHADLYGRLAARLQGVPVVSTYHCDDPPRLRWPVKQLDSITSTFCCEMICVSEAVRRFVRGPLGYPPGKLNVVYHGLEQRKARSAPDLREMLGIPRQAALVGIVARLVEQKGHAYLLQAMKIVVGEFQDAHLIVIGDGELRSQLTALALRLGIGKNVHFLGFRADAYDLMCQLDIFAHPSLFEGFGIVLLEAMAAARPVIATNVSAIPEIVLDGHTGILVRPRESFPLAAAICRLIQTPGLARRLGEAGRQRLEREFTLRNMLEATINVYRKVLPC